MNMPKKMKEEIVFMRCTLIGPDGEKRPAWEMRKGALFFGRADSKEELVRYYERLHGPMPTGHWKDRAWKNFSTSPRKRSKHPQEVE